MKLELMPVEGPRESLRGFAQSVNSETASLLSERIVWEKRVRTEQNRKANFNGKLHA